MLMDRRTDTVTAVVTSVNATLRNKPAMAVWAAIIAGCVVVSTLNAWLAFAVLLPASAMPPGMPIATPSTPVNGRS